MRGRSGAPQDRTFTKCGTPGYSAPEVLLQEEGSSVFNIRANINTTASITTTTMNDQNQLGGIQIKQNASPGKFNNNSFISSKQSGA